MIIASVRSGLAADRGGARRGKLCLDVMSEDGLQNDGARLQLYHCTGVSEQKFLLVPANSGEGPIPGLYEIRPRSSPGKCLVPDSNRSAFTGQPVPDGQGAQVEQQSCIFFAQVQNWTLKSTNEIVNQFYGTCLDTTGSGSRDHEHVMIWPSLPRCGSHPIVTLSRLSRLRRCRPLRRQ